MDRLGNLVNAEHAALSKRYMKNHWRGCHLWQGGGPLHYRDDVMHSRKGSSYLVKSDLAK